MVIGAASLPVRPGTTESWEGVSPFVRAETSAHILLADDDDSVRGITALMLRCAGYDVLTATDGLEAWDMLRRTPVDLLITDHNMPRLTGLALIARARAWRSDLPTILISGLLDPKDLSPAHLPVIDAMLMKPFGSRLLLGTVASCLKQGRLHRHVAEAQHAPA